ncbi:MAG: hypothetical protein ACK40G_13805 [Cytophagaceae bacterium]
MILPFSKNNPITKQPTEFPDKILAGIKINSIRYGYRWRAGMSIQMATGARTKYYYQFNKDRPDLQECISTQNIEIIPAGKAPKLGGYEMYTDHTILIEGKVIDKKTIELLAKNDGFDSLEDFWVWFGNDHLDGQIIHWTDFKY